MSKTLQLKRITGNYDNHKNDVLADGEPIIIETNVEEFDYNPPFIVVGDGRSTITSLVGSGKVFLPLGSIEEIVVNIVHSGSNGADSTPEGITSEASQAGSSTQYARADHKHNISKETIINSLGDTYRNITAGVSDPNPNDGKIGDIYIKYE